MNGGFRCSLRLLYHFICSAPESRALKLAGFYDPIMVLRRFGSNSSLIPVQFSRKGKVMNMDEMRNKNVGALVISEEVVARIASVAAMDIAGVAKVTPPTVNLKGFMKRQESSKAVKITNTDEETVIDIHLVLESGAKIKPTVEAVQASVKEAVQNMTGRVVTKVNVHVEDLILKA